MSVDIVKQMTDNPFMDTVLYNVKKLAYNCTLKNEEYAISNETEQSLKKAEMFIYAKKNSAEFTLYTSVFTEAMLLSVGIPSAYVIPCLRNPNIIIQDYPGVVNDLIKLAREYIIDNYEEQNNYYRKITGLPPYGENGIGLAQYIGSDSNVPANIRAELLSEASFVHELGSDAAKILVEYGVMDAIKNNPPPYCTDIDYLDYMPQGIDIYKARVSADKQILYLESCGIIEIDELFEEKFELARRFTDMRVASDAMDIDSEHYHSFLCIYILFTTITDCISEIQDRIVKKDVLDARCIEYIFEMYGVPYYKKIPLKYQIIMCKNINTMLQYKSSPQEMFNLITYFGADDINIMKYYLLRDRLYDSDGNPIFTEKTRKSCIENTIVMHETQTISSSISSPVTITYPFDYFLAKGNVLFVFLDDVRQAEGTDYVIQNYDQIKFLNPTAGTHTIRIEYYYDKDTINGYAAPDTTRSVRLKYQTIVNTDPSIYTFKLIPPDVDYFTKKKNDILLCIAGIMVNPECYSVDKTNNTVTLNPSYYLSAPGWIVIIYVYGDNVQSRFVRKEIDASVNNQTTFSIPEPFKNYAIYENSFFISIGSTYVDTDRYTIDNVNATITFTDGTSLLKGRSITFNFIYSMWSIYEDFILNETKETIIATQYYQCDFTLHLPDSEYVNKGYKVYVKLRGWFLDDSYFDVYGDTLSFRDKSIFLDPGDKIEIYYKYVSFEGNVNVKNVATRAVSRFQTQFTIEYPIANFFKKDSILIVSSAGYPLVNGVDYTISGTNDEILTLINPDFYPYKGQRINCEFIYVAETENSIRIKQTNMEVSADGISSYIVDIPFINYFESGHDMIVAIHSTIIEKDMYDITLSDSGLLDHIIFKIPSNSDLYLKKGDQISFIFIYNNYYMMQRNQVLIVEQTTVSKDDVDSNGGVIIPEPFEDYTANDWPYFIDSNKTWIDPSTYDNIDASILFDEDQTIQDYYTFTFIYKDEDPWTKIISFEDYSKDIELGFLKLPIDAFMESPVYVKKKECVKNYDSVTYADPKWDGDEGSSQESIHEALKEKILELEFNHSRTKYMTIDYLVDAAEMSFQIPFFYNMLWDDVYLEDDVTIEVPSILPYHKFKVAEIFCYMTALMYLFKGIKDTIMETPTSIMFVRGFNFKADLNKLKLWIDEDQRRDPNDFNVFNFITPTTSYKDFNEMIDTYHTNREVYKTIVNAMANADTYDIWYIWKHLYDSLMIWEFNLKYFTINIPQLDSNGNIMKDSSGNVIYSETRKANTFTEFLQYHDEVLYSSIKSIESIDNDDTRNETIIETIEDIVYILDAYMDTEEFRYVFDQFPGGSQEILMEYLFMMINFFKSYKVVMTQYTTDLNFDNPDENYIKPIDRIIMQCKLLKPDYISGREMLETSRITLYKKDTHNIHEACMFKYRYD